MRIANKKVMGFAATATAGTLATGVAISILNQNPKPTPKRGNIAKSLKFSGPPIPGNQVKVDKTGTVISFPGRPYQIKCDGRHLRDVPQSNSNSDQVELDPIMANLCQTTSKDLSALDGVIGKEFYSDIRAGPGWANYSDLQKGNALGLTNAAWTIVYCHSLGAASYPNYYVRFAHFVLQDSDGPADAGSPADALNHDLLQTPKMKAESFVQVANELKAKQIPESFGRTLNSIFVVPLTRFPEQVGLVTINGGTVFFSVFKPSNGTFSSDREACQQLINEMKERKVL